MCAHLGALYVCQAADPQDEDSAVKFSAQIFNDISVCLLPKSKAVIFSAFFKGTHMKGEKEMYFFSGGEEASEVNNGWREKQKQSSANASPL